MDRCERSSRYEESSRSVNETSSRHHKQSERKDLEDKVKTVKDQQTQFREEMLLVSGCDVMDDDPLRRGRRMIDEGEAGLKILRWTAIGPLAEAVKAAGTMMLEGVSASNLQTVVDCAARMSAGKVAQIYNCAKQAFRGYNMGLTLVGNDGDSSSRSPESAEKSTAKSELRSSNKVEGVIQETLKGKGNITSQYKLSSSEALTTGEKFLGNSYKELGRPGQSGVFRSQDGTRQFRMDNNSLMGNHNPYKPHVHLETYQPGSRKYTTNNHVIIED